MFARRCRVDPLGWMVIDLTPKARLRAGLLILFQGPAKVYTLRGKYRQYFLRVNANGEAEYGPANLRVDKDRTLQAVIETIVRYHPSPASRSS